jgi:hypothetical protein
MMKPHCHLFEWDDENKKNGNVQHLRDHGIEPKEAEECFFHEFLFARDERRFDDIYFLDGKTTEADACDSYFKIKGTDLCECLLAGN